MGASVEDLLCHRLEQSLMLRAVGASSLAPLMEGACAALAHSCGGPLHRESCRHRESCAPGMPGRRTAGSARCARWLASPRWPNSNERITTTSCTLHLA